MIENLVIFYSEKDYRITNLKIQYIYHSKNIFLLSKGMRNTHL